jgi:peptide deformylase
MAIRNIREIGDSVLNKVSREITVVDKKLNILIDDMVDTLYEANGVGLAAPQVGILKRLVVIDVSEEGNDPIILINPVIIETEGEQIGDEACLSVPGKVGTVTRPNYVKVKALNRKMEEFTVEGTGLLARALCHEIDHLDGVLYVERKTGELRNSFEEEEE